MKQYQMIIHKPKGLRGGRTREFSNKHEFRKLIEHLVRDYGDVQFTIHNLHPLKIDYGEDSEEDALIVNNPLNRKEFNKHIVDNFMNPESWQ